MELTDKRRAQRTNISVAALFYKIDEDGQKTEFEAVIKDISETGVYFEATIPKSIEVCQSLKKGDKLSFVFVDEFELFGKEHTAIIQDDAYIVRSKSDNKIMMMGCEIKVKSEDIESYIENKEVSYFLKAQKDK